MNSSSDSRRLLDPILALALLLGATACSSAADYAAEREAMVREIQLQVIETRGELGTDRLAQRVLDAIRAVPRHALLPAELRPQAYRNRPLPIGQGQTISQPYIVAIMSHLLDIEPGDKVYELGTGSGYQAAVLAEMGANVYSVEIVPELAARARDTLKRLGYDKVQIRTGDGYRGWPEAAPFDGIIITAAGNHVPQPLLSQLAPGGRLLMPVGDTTRAQDLTLMEKLPDGSLQTKRVLPVRFVPVTGPSIR